MKYRTDVDGLRGIAVLLVLFFHAGTGMFPSGFIGVDIFFVISGFLISTIVKESINSNAFSFSEFYLRRMWRLLPAMLVMMCFSLVIATIFYLPADYEPFLKSIKKTILFVSNRYFGDETTGYAAPDADSMLLLHTWSLSIEWQWYLIYPVTFFILSKKIAFQKLIYIALLFTVCGLIVTYHYSDKNPTKTYYFFASRIFEFLIGVCASFFVKQPKKLNSVFADSISIVAIVAIFIVSLKSNIILGYPDIFAFIVCVSTAILLVNNQTVVSKLLSFSPLVWVGSISYSLYLFHWPIFAGLHYISNDNTYIKFAGALLSFFLAIACYYSVEKPFRKPRFGICKSLLLLFVLPLLMILFFILISKRLDGFSYIRFGNSLSHINYVLKSTYLKQRQECMNENVSGTNMDCVVGDKNSSVRALLIGDSHSNQYWNFFDIMGKEAHVSVDMKATSLCLAIPDVYHDDKYLYEGSFYKTCHENVIKYYDSIRAKKYKYVIISQVWPNYAMFNVRYDLSTNSTTQDSIKVISKATDEGVKQIVEAGAIPILVNTMFEMPNNFLTCFYEHFKTREKYVANECNPNPRFSKRTWVDRLFSSLKEKYPTLIIIDPKDVQCPDGLCKTEIDGIPLYRDVGHLNDYAATVLGEQYLQQRGNPLLLK